VTFPVYAIDDDTAIAVTSAGVEVVSEGTWAYYDGGGVVRSHEQPTASPTSRDRTPSSLRTH
jgi:hypothetical protein